MATSIHVGDIELVAMKDGEFAVSPDYFGPGTSFAGHESLLGEDGQMHLPIGCFLLRGPGIRGRTVLVDAGLGDQFTEMVGPYTGGHLLEELAVIGCDPSEIDAVVCSHLHIDHCGWIIHSHGTPVFENAQLWVGAADWNLFVEEEAGFMAEHVRVGLRELAVAGRLSLIETDRTIAPGLDAMAAPGHTPGHQMIVVSSGSARALLLGDAMNCPAQLDETDWGAMSDVDPGLARRTRERLWSELERPGTIGTELTSPIYSSGA